jgi:hypothetical protein
MNIRVSLFLSCRIVSLQHLTGFLVVESHVETSPSLRIDKPFPALLDHALSLDFANMDPTEHTHIPYVVILVRALEDWKQSVSMTIHHFPFEASRHGALAY